MWLTGEFNELQESQIIRPRLRNHRTMFLQQQILTSVRATLVRTEQAAEMRTTSSGATVPVDTPTCTAKQVQNPTLN